MIAEVLQGSRTHKDTENHWVNSKNNSFVDIWQSKLMGTWFSIAINAEKWKQLDGNASISVYTAIYQVKF